MSLYAAEAFIPDRHLEDIDEATAPLRDPRNYIFGFGRKCAIIVPVIPAG